MSLTDENLMAAFAGESQANRKYLAFAEKAAADGYARASKMFKAAAMAETVHALAHFKAAGGVNSTADNLAAAFKGESFEYEIMYPPMIKAAEEEKNDAALKSFKFAHEAEKVHAELYKNILDNLEAGVDSDFHVCKVCGNVVEGDTPDTCGICGAGKQAFDKVE
ncbi:rubrerythrin family protein [Nitrospirota bacterium]